MTAVTLRAVPSLEHAWALLLHAWEAVCSMLRVTLVRKTSASSQVT